MRFLRSTFFQIILVNFSLFLISWFFVKYYYAIGLPYYDSVGSYVNMFSIANTTRQLGLSAGVIQATDYSLSWLQSFFAVFTAYIFPSKPEWMILLNFIVLFFAQLTIFKTVKNLNLGNKKAVILSSLPLLPGVAFGWAGGYIDMRRDSTFFPLLVVLFFGFYDYMNWPSLKKGLILGILFGFTHWSRGNSLPYIICIVLPILIIAAARYIGTNKKFMFLQYLAVTFFLGAMIAVPYYLISWKDIYEKYMYGSWGIGQPRLPAVITFLKMTPLMILGPERNTLLLNAIFFLLLGVTIYFLIKKRIFLIRKSWYKRQAAIDLLLGGVLVYLFILILNAIILGVGSYVFPNIPALVGIFAISVYLAGGLTLNKNKKVKQIIFQMGILSWTIAILLLNSLRIYISMPPSQEKLVTNTRKAAYDLSPVLGGKSVSYLWLDHINVHDLNFYITQKGGLPINATSHLSDYVDTEMPPDPSKSISKQQKEYARALRSRGHIIISEDLNSYGNSNGFFFILKYGKPIIKELLNDPSMERIYSFKADNVLFVVLRNKKI